jgi:hypothetical protein
VWSITDFKHLSFLKTFHCFPWCVQTACHFLTWLPKSLNYGVREPLRRWQLLLNSLLKRFCGNEYTQNNRSTLKLWGRESGVEWLRVVRPNKKFLEELIAYFTWYDTGHTKNDASNNFSIVACVLVTAVTFLPSRCLAMIGGFLPSRCLATIRGFLPSHSLVKIGGCI